MADSFSASLTDWARRTEGRMLAVLKDSAQRVANEVRVPIAAGGNMPVRTGNLRRSLGASTNSMPAVREGVRFDNDPGSDISLTIQQMVLGQTLYLGFQANYAPYMENRYGFVRLTAQRWQQIVAESARDIESRVEGR